MTIASAGRAVAAGAEKPTISIVRVSEPPEITRYLDGTVTPPGTRISGLVQREPGDGVPASVETTVYLSYDARHLYAVFICKDDPAKIRANMTKREAIMGDDIVGLLLDTYHDGRRAYQFLVNPHGIQLDGVATEGQDDDYSYDTLWQSDGRLTKDGYVVVIAIPFKSLRFSNAPTQTWGVAVTRSVPRANELSFWPYITRRISGFGQQLATLEGLTGISPGRNLQIIPYGDFAAARVVDDAGVRVTESSARAGLDGKAVIKDALTVDMTVNPDFSQVESDEPQVTVNQRFEVFFPEKRPFFIENAGYFETPQNLFFSRRVADPGVGVRLTGKARGWAFGVLGVNDEEPGRQVGESDARSGKKAGIGVFRAQREFARQSYLGAIFTDVEFGASREPGLRRRRPLEVHRQLDRVGPVGRQPDRSTRRATRPAGPPGSRRSAAKGGASTTWGVSPREAPTSGRTLGTSAGWTCARCSRKPATRGTRRTAASCASGPTSRPERCGTMAGSCRTGSSSPASRSNCRAGQRLGGMYVAAFERYQGIEFRRDGAMVRANTDWLSWLGVGVHYFRGSGINYYPAEGLEPFLGAEQSVEAQVTLRPFSRLRLDQAYLYSDLSTSSESALPAGAPRGRIFTDHILRTRINYQFTRELSARVILDYEIALAKPGAGGPGARAPVQRRRPVHVPRESMDGHLRRVLGWLREQAAGTNLDPAAIKGRPAADVRGPAGVREAELSLPILSGGCSDPQQVISATVRGYVRGRLRGRCWPGGGA